MSTATTELRATIFPDLAAGKRRELSLSWEALVERVRAPQEHATKERMPLIKLARFGDARSAGGSLRHDANIEFVYGIEGDYDAGEVSLADAATLLAERDVCAVLYSSPSSTPERPRWRVLAPLSSPCAPAMRRELVGRLNAVLGGILAPESFTTSQSFYVGRAKTAAHYEMQEVRGARCIDELDIEPQYPINGHANVGPSAAAEAVGNDPILRTLRERGLLKRQVKPGTWAIACPWEGEHTGAGGETATVYLLPAFDGRQSAGFRCLHGHCTGRTLRDLLAYLDVRGPAERRRNGAGDAEVSERHGEPQDAPAADSDGAAWPAPQPLTAKVAAEPYPLDALPDTIRGAVEEVQSFVQAPVPLVASCALSAVSVACQALVDVERAARLQGPVGLFLLTIADSGERKTTADGFFTSVLREHDKKQAELGEPEIRQHRAKLAAWEAQCAGIAAAIREATKSGKPTGKQEAELARLHQERPEAPRIPRLLYSDVTPEALGWSLAKGWPSAALLSSEAGAVFGSHGMGADSVMRNLALLNIAWDGGTLHSDRRTTESWSVSGARLTAGLQVQEPTLRAFMDRAGALARGSGFLARFLVAWPESTQGFRPFTEAPEHWPRLAAFNRRLAAILEQPAPLTEQGSLAPQLLTLAPAAKEAWIALHDAVEAELRPNGELADVRDAASKAADNVARVAALFHLFEGAGGPIGPDAVARAGRIVAWHLNESRRFFGELALPAELADAIRLDGWILDYCRERSTCTVAKNHVRQHGPLRHGDRLNAALRELEELDRVRIDKQGRRLSLRVNPELLR